MLSRDGCRSSALYVTVQSSARSMALSASRSSSKLVDMLGFLENENKSLLSFEMLTNVFSDTVLYRCGHMLSFRSIVL